MERVRVSTLLGVIVAAAVMVDADVRVFEEPFVSAGS